MIKYEEDSDNIIYEQIIPDPKTSIKLVEINISKEEIKTQVPKHWHRSIEIIIPLVNSSEIWIEGKIYTVSPGDFLVVNSKEIHSCRGLYPVQDYFGYAFQIKYDFIKACFESIDDYAFYHCCHNHHDYIYYLLQGVIDISKKEDKLKHIKVQGLVYEILFQLLENNSYKKDKSYTIKSSKHKEILAQIQSYLLQHSDEYMDSKMISDHFGLSYGYIAKLFKKYLKMTMGEYINFIRIKKIERDLILTDESIMDICMKHGYTNTKSFYREFSKYHDQTPKEYRKSSRYKK